MASDIDTRKPHAELKGFYLIEGTDCYINMHGRIWSENRSQFLSPYLGQYSTSSLYGTYPSVHLTGHPSASAVHVLVAEAFVEKPKDLKNPIVNHIDGDKNNFSASNLEWVSMSDNITHAFKAGLRTDNKPVLLKDLETGKIVKHYSMNECSRHLGINTSTLHLYMKKEQTLPLLKKWDVVFEGKAWNPIPKSAIGMERLGKDRTIVGVQKSTRTVVIFSSVARAVEYTGVAKHVIWKRLERSVKPKLKFGGPPEVKIDWDFFYHKDYTGDLNNVREILGPTRAGSGLIRPIKQPIPIKVTNLKTGEIKNYPSSQAFADEHGVKKGTVQNAVYLTGRWREYEIEYLKPLQK